MSKSQNTKDEQQKDLCITSEQLTELWKKGELLEDLYYVRCAWSDEVETRYVHNGVDDWQEIIAKVPSYGELQNMDKAVNECMAANIKLVEQNKQLKELLKECLPYISRSLTSRMIKNSAGYKKDAKLLTKINQVLGEE